MIIMHCNQNQCIVFSIFYESLFSKSSQQFVIMHVCWFIFFYENKKKSQIQTTFLRDVRYIHLHANFIDSYQFIYLDSRNVYSHFVFVSNRYLEELLKYILLHHHNNFDLAIYTGEHYIIK